MPQGWKEDKDPLTKKAPRHQKVMLMNKKKISEFSKSKITPNKLSVATESILKEVLQLKPISKEMATLQQELTECTSVNDVIEISAKIFNLILDNMNKHPELYPHLEK